MKTLVLYLFLLFPITVLSQTLNLKTTKLEICDGHDNVVFINDTCDVYIIIKNDTLLLKNIKTDHYSLYIFSEIIESGDGFTSWKCKDPEKNGVILFYLQEKQKDYYIFYIFLLNQTYRYHCEKM